jgi:hypothetical protein
MDTDGHGWTRIFQKSTKHQHPEKLQAPNLKDARTRTIKIRIKIKIMGRAGFDHGWRRMMKIRNQKLEIRNSKRGRNSSPVRKWLQALFSSHEFYLPGANFANWKLISAARFQNGGFSRFRVVRERVSAENVIFLGLTLSQRCVRRHILLI